MIGFTTEIDLKNFTDDHVKKEMDIQSILITLVVATCMKEASLPQVS